MIGSRKAHAVITPDTYEWAYLGAQATEKPADFTAQAQIEGVSEPELFTAEVAEIGNAASWEIAIAHRGLIKSVANRYAGMIRRSPALDFDDLVSAGTEAVFGYAGKYFPKMDQLPPGSFFYKAAFHGVMAAINDHISTVRIPRHVRPKLRRLDVLRSYRDPATGVGISPDTAFELVGASEDKDRKRLELARLVSYEMGSIDNGFSPQVDNPSANDYSPRMESVFDVGKPGDIELSESGARAAQIREVLPELGLSDRELGVVRLRLGISEDGGTPAEPMTLEEVGKIFGLTRERIRVIEAKALAKLRNPTRADRLCPPETVVHSRLIPSREYIDVNGNKQVIPAEVRTRTYQSRVIE